MKIRKSDIGTLHSRRILFILGATTEKESCFEYSFTPGRPFSYYKL